MSIMYLTNHPKKTFDLQYKSEAEKDKAKAKNIIDYNEFASERAQPSMSLEFWLTQCNSIGFPKFLFLIFIISALLLSQYARLDTNDDEFYIQNLESCEIYILDCSCMTEMFKEGKGNYTDMKAINDFNNFTGVRVLGC